MESANKVGSDLIRGSIDTIILRCLQRGEMYGLEICNLIKEASGGTYILKQPTLYSSLKRLEQRKLIIGIWRDNKFGGKRHYYKLTDKGQNSFDDKKSDWQFSKLVIDNLVSDKDSAQEIALPTDFQKVELPLHTPAVAAAGVTPIVLPVHIPAQESRVVVAARHITPLETYVATAGDYITVPLSQRATAVLNPYNLPEPKVEPVAVSQVVQAPEPKQIPVEMPKPQIIIPPVEITPFVKHSAAKRCGKFVLYNRLRLVCSAFVCLALAASLVLVRLFLKGGILKPEEISVLALGWVCAAVYVLANIALYTANPRYKRVVASRARDITRRGVFALCIGVAAISLNVIAGLSAINAEDYMVYWIVPCVLAAGILIEGIAIWGLRKRQFFLT